MKTIALILAAGRGSRAGEGLPKTYRSLDGEAILTHSVRQFLNHDDIDAVQVVIHPDDRSFYEAAVREFDLPKPVMGGDTRADSVKNGLESCKGYQNVLIHDGARPYISGRLISGILEALLTHQGAVPTLPIADAIWQCQNEKLIEPVPRENLRRAQTPQGFRLDAYLPIAQGGLARDDAEVAIAAGLDVVWIEGEEENLKLTYPKDFQK